MLGNLEPDERVLSQEDPMSLTPEMIKEINKLMAHTKKNGQYNWTKNDTYEVAIAGTFAADRFIVIHNRSKKPWVPAEPHPRFDYDKKEFKKDK